MVAAVSSARAAACSSRVRLSRVSCSWWAASWSRIAAIGSLLVMVSSRGRCRRHVTGDDRFGPPGRGRELMLGRGVQAAGAAVGGVAPGAGQPGDDRGAAAADDQGEPGGQLADHVRGGDVVAGGVVLAADLPRRLPAQRARRLQRGDVGDAGQEHLDRAGVEHDLAAVVAPPFGELSFAVHDGDDLDALAAGVRQPGRQRDRADLGHLVQAHQQRRVQPTRRRRLAPSAPRSSGSPTPSRRTAARPGLPR